MSNNLPADCYSESGLLSVEECGVRILADTQQLLTEYVNLDGLRGRVLAQDVYTPFDLPRFTHSAMDGYAIKLTSKAQPSFRVAGVQLAGDDQAFDIANDTAVKVMTGGKLPNGANCVIPIENGDLLNGIFTPHRDCSLKNGLNIRYQGEELRAETLLLKKGKLLSAPDITILATLGIHSVEVIKLIRVGIFSTGNELTEPKDPLLNNSCIYDANRYALKTLVSDYPVDIIDFGILPDQKSALMALLDDVGSRCDVLISSAGVSKGDADIIRQSIKVKGTARAYNVKMKPGKPIAFGLIDHMHFFGLPGNPVAAIVSYKRFVEPALRKMLGLPMLTPIKAVLTETIHSKVGRTEYVRGKMMLDDQAQLRVSAVAKQGSAQLTGLLEANVLIEVDEASSQVECETTVSVWPLTNNYMDLF